MRSSPFRLALAAWASTLVLSTALAVVPGGAAPAGATASVATDPSLGTIVHNVSDSPEVSSNGVATANEGDDTYVAWREGNRVAVRAIRDHGLTEDPVTTLVDPDGPGRLTSDAPGIAAVGDDVFVTWSEGVKDPDDFRYERYVWEVFLAVSHDRGATFGPPEQLGDLGGDPAHRPKLAASADVIALVWEGAGRSVVLTERPTAGGAWTRHLVGSAGNGEYEVAVSGPTVHVAWIDGAVSAVRLAGSGGSLSAPVVLGKAGNDSHHPDLVVSGSTVAVGWIDYRGNGGSLSYHPVWASVSTDGGASFRGTQVNTKAHSCGSTCGGPGPQVGIAAGRVHVIFDGGSTGLHEAIVLSGLVLSRTPVGGATAPAYGTLQDAVVTDHVVVVTWTRASQATHRTAVFDSARRHGSGTWTTRSTGYERIGFSPVIAPLGTGGDYTLAWNVVTVDLGLEEVLVRPGALADPDLVAFSVIPVQAAAANERLVAGKPTAFRARVRSGFPSAQRISARWTIDDGDGSPLEVVGTHLVAPGVTTLTFVPPAPFEVAAGTVAVSMALDPGNVLAETDETNNEASHAGLPVVRTGRRDVLYVPLTGAGDAVPCRTVQMMEATSRPFLDAVWPVDPAHSASAASCTTRLVWDPDPDDLPVSYGKVLSTLTDQLEGSLETWENVVVVVPAGWITKNIEEAENAVGIANVRGGDGIVIVDERTNGGTNVAHEISHDLRWVTGPIEDHGKTKHHASNHHAPGYWVDRTTAVDQRDFMHPTVKVDTVALQSWISSETWAHLLAVEQARAAHTAAGPARGLAVHGLVGDDGSVEAGSWRTVELPATRSADDGEVTVTVVDRGGDELSSVDLRLSEAVDGEPSGPSRARSFSGVVPDLAGAAAVEVRVDGEPALRRTRSAAAPTVRLAAPAAGSTVAPGGELEVTWTADDADGDDLQADVERSTDDGATWIPARSGVAGSSATIGITPELAGDLLVRVTVGDGWRTSVATSGPVRIESGVANGRVAFTRHPDGVPSLAELWTAAPDGTDAHLLLARQAIPGELGRPAIASPAWSPDGDQLVVDLGDANDLAVLDADGSGLRRLGLTGRFRTPVPAGIHVSSLTCPTWSPDGEEIAFVETGYGPDGTKPLGSRIWAVGADGAGLRLVQEGGAGASACALDWTGGDAGEFLWFVDVPPSGTRGIDVVRPDGSGRRRFLTPPVGEGMIAALSVAPDGSSVAYATGSRAQQIWLAGTDGSTPVQLTRMPWSAAESAWVRDVAWAPDGRRLVAHVHEQTWAGGSSGAVLEDRLELIDALTGERTPFAVAPGVDDRTPAWQAVPAAPAPAPDPVPVVRAEIAVPTGAVEGSEVVLDASGSWADAGIVEVRWDLDGDGTFADATGPRPSVTFPDDGHQPVAVEVVDELGQSAVATAVVVVADAPPEITDAVVVRRSGDLVLDATVVNPGTDPLTAEVTWPGGAVTPATTVRADDGRWLVAAVRPTAVTGGTVGLVVDDGDGGTDRVSVAVTPTPVNQPPTVVPAVAVRTHAGVAVEVDPGATDPDGAARDLRLEVTTAPARGTVAVVPGVGPGGPLVVYTPGAGRVGVDTFTVVAVDAAGGRSAPAVITVAVEGPQPEPTSREFELPVRGGSAVNLAITGRPVALRWKGGAGAAVRSATATPASCLTWKPTEPGQSLGAAGVRGADGSWSLAWVPRQAHLLGCRVVEVTLQDGTVLRARFLVLWLPLR